MTPLSRPCCVCVEGQRAGAAICSLFRNKGPAHQTQSHYTDITELTLELLRMFIRKIVVHEKSAKRSKKALQTIEIHYSDIGWIGGEVPQNKKSPRQEISV